MCAGLSLQCACLQVRALAAAVLSSMLEGPAQKAYLIIAEAKSSARPPVRYENIYAPVLYCLH